MAAREIEFDQLTVLVVEDEKFVRNLIARQLQALGVETVLECADGAEALAVLRQLTPDVVLCDINMAPIDGLAVLRNVRNGDGGIDRQTPIVFVTGNSERDTVVTAMRAEVDGYLVKPVTLNDLKAKITTALAKRVAGRISG